VTQTTRPASFWWYAASAGLAWLGLAVSLALNLTGFYDSDVVTSPSRYGYANGAATPIPQRLADWISYFTIWSNITVAAVATILARRALRSPGSPTPRVLNVIRLSSLVMITITGLVYAVVLAPTSVQRGIDNLSNSLLHQITPILAVIVWVIVGPRREFCWLTVLLSTLLPLTWILWMLARGAATGTYPYDFINAKALGWSTALSNLGGVLLLGIAVAFVFLGLDRLLARRRVRT
jgi:hypothetical protein